jgi:hypothetical protein
MNESRKNHLMEFLNGSFSLKRTISRPEMLMMGDVIFRRESEKVIEYWEHGHYFLDGGALESYQKRYFIFESGILSIYNSQKEMMHEAIPIFLSKTRCRFTHVHRCKKDTYGLDCRISDPIVHMNDTITGPFKNHSIHTCLEKNHKDRVENKPYDPK